MAGNSDSKRKLLALLQVFQRETDESNYLTSAEIIDKLQTQYGIHAERKSIYSDIELLNRMGYEITLQKGAAGKGGYYLSNRIFEEVELKLLADAVQASKFITARKSDALIQKLESMTSRHQASALRRQVFIHNRVKSSNEMIFIVVDKIHTAMSTGVQIRFRMREWTLSKEVRLRKEGKIYQVSPWALAWQDENYYLIGYDCTADTIRHYRVDKLCNLELTELHREGVEAFKAFDLPNHISKTFYMFGGKEERVTFRCAGRFIGVMMDRYGSDAKVIPNDGDNFLLVAEVAVSPQFFGWLAGLGKEVELLAPVSVRQAYMEYLQDILTDYTDQLHP